MVGEVMLKVLAEESDTDELILVASERSVGKERL
jgi:aspartate-semialdehyde dehydrogenase